MKFNKKFECWKMKDESLNKAHMQKSQKLKKFKVEIQKQSESQKIKDESWNKTQMQKRLIVGNLKKLKAES